MSLVLEIRLLSYWRAGTGRGQAGSLDAVCRRDEFGLPMLPGKHLRGLLRDAVDKAHQLNWTKVPAERLFGSRSKTSAEVSEGALLKGQAPEDLETRRGVLRIESAVLPEAERNAIAALGDDLAPLLFAVKRSTEIDVETRAAKPKSLRAEEVALPVTLEARVHAMEPVGNDLWQALHAALPLVRAVGADRTRGLGRCILTARDAVGTADE